MATTSTIRSSKDYVKPSKDTHRKVLILKGAAEYPEWKRDVQHNITADNAWGLISSNVPEATRPQFNPIPTTDIELKELRDDLPKNTSLSDINNILVSYKR